MEVFCISLITLKCFHGTTLQSAESILLEKHFRPSVKDEGLRLGRGAYFYGKMGESDYAQKCAYETARYHYYRGRRGNEYAILSCDAICEEQQFFDMYEQVVLEAFHEMRHALYTTMVNRCHYEFRDCAELDTMTMNRIRESSDIAIIRCPQFFGFLENEQRIRFRRSPKPLTYVPNVVLTLVDTEKAVIENIKIEDRGVFND